METIKNSEDNKITIYPVTRIEGHAKITIHLDNDLKVDKVYFHVDQFRGFEKFSEGRHFKEMPIITAKICGICPVSHILGAVKAGDMIMGVNIPYTAKLLRELIHMGQIIQSHSLHFFYLASPDLLLGWDENPKIRNIAGVIEKYPDIATKGVELRKFGQSIIEWIAGARINPKWIVPGGMANSLTPQVKDKILLNLPKVKSHILFTINLFKDYIQKNKDFIIDYANFDTGYLGLVSNNDSLELYDGKIRYFDKNLITKIEFLPKDYLNYIAEYIEDWSYLKFPFLKIYGYPEGVYRVGPLARLNIINKIDTELANKELQEFKNLSNNGKAVSASFYYHYARLIEILYAIEKVELILNDKEILSKDVYIENKVVNEEGIGVIEAPRGTLIHHYWVDEKGTIKKVNMIVASGHNNWAMSKAVEVIAKKYIDMNNLTEGILNRVEGGIRCYDPCLSCSTHAVGNMPILIEIYDNQKKLIKTIKRE
ncbi:MAG: Ni/Fe hydrogenase subunit alpha [bacterium]|nr:Ni/Fe hydrogenase subunit alpha [bacterium]